MPMPMPLPLQQSHCPNEMMPLSFHPRRKRVGIWMTDFHSVLPLGEAWPIHHGHGRLAFLSTDLGSSGQLAMPAKGTVPSDTTTDMEARQSSGIFAKGMLFSLYYQYQFEQEAVWNQTVLGALLGTMYVSLVMLLQYTGPPPLPGVWMLLPKCSSGTTG
ncbi:hypothetical protein PVAP13_4NG303138 [Panicum virgatum]|uniref:Uncharacterized protein n=1 Tax=Panicum virgatum TaxID=38727 RepID=A0A8T0TFN8_PANVG|nr:hypothetical protein PVAP13_4NG303138 [Panicum virgatum]